MNRVLYGWIFNKTDEINSEGKEIWTAKRRKETIRGSYTDIVEIIKRIAEKDVREQ